MLAFLPGSQLKFFNYIYLMLTCTKDATQKSFQCRARRKLLGHILRSADDSPAALALKFAVYTTQCKGPVGAHRKNLFTIIDTLTEVLKYFTL